MASHHLIDDHLAALARRLPAGAVDELADGLTETWQHHLRTGSSPADAARAAIAEFGTVEQIVHAFVAESSGRRIARTLLASGPLVGACWGATLVATRAWTWSVPTVVAAAFGTALIAVVVALLAAATSRRSYRRARLGSLGGFGLTALDVAMLAGVTTFASTLAWPMLIAVPASLARIVLTLRATT